MSRWFLLRSLTDFQPLPLMSNSSICSRHYTMAKRNLMLLSESLSIRWRTFVAPRRFSDLANSLVVSYFFASTRAAWFLLATHALLGYSWSFDTCSSHHAVSKGLSRTMTSVPVKIADLIGSHCICICYFTATEFFIPIGYGSRLTIPW